FAGPVPAKACEVLHAGREQQTAVVAELEREPRRRNRAARDDAYGDGQRLARLELEPLLPVGAEQPLLRDLHLAASILAQPGRALLRVAFVGEQLLVTRDRVVRRAVELDAALAQQDG